MSIHKNKEYCPGCELKKKEMHPELQIWFDEVRKEFPDAHCSCAFREEKDQKKAFDEGKSKVTWPNSKHNAVGKLGLPRARAFDIFMIDSTGKAVFDKKYYGKVAAKLLEWNAPIIWGGDWKNWKDFPHFELSKGVA